MKDKKTLIKFGIGIFVFLFLVIGATYAYFTMNITNSYENRKITGKIEEQGHVALQLANDFYMNLTAYDMQNKGSDVSYFASSTGTKTTDTEEIIGTTSVVGEQTYYCTYTLNVNENSENSMYEAFQNMVGKSNGQIVLTVNGIDYDFNTENLFPLKIDGSMKSVTKTNPGQITAKLKMVNSSSINQTAISNTDIHITFNVEDFNCETSIINNTLAEVVMEKANDYNVYKPDFTNPETLQESDYENFAMSYSGYVSYYENDYFEGDILEPMNNISTYTSDKKWTFNFDDALNIVYSATPNYSWWGTPSIIIDFENSETGYYRLCYDTNYSTIIYITANSENYVIPNISDSNGVKNYGCQDIGYLNSKEKIKINFQDYEGYDYDYDVSFYLEKTNKNSFEETHYRYSGKDPNNYVNFNNELWRIIGVIPTCTSSDCNTKENLIKIIRNDQFEKIAYDAKLSGTTIWGNNTLYKLLNENYFGAKNGTNSGYCYSNQNTTATTCNYTSIGINPNSEYGKMLQNVYWNTGVVSNDVPVRISYLSEMDKQTVSGYIGLMNASDFKFAGGSSSWLKKNKSDEWTINESYIYDLNYLAIFTTANYPASPEAGRSYRPVVYLNSKVFVIDGDGSNNNPYKITR